MDIRREGTVNLTPGTVYTSTDLGRERILEKSVRVSVTGSGWGRGRGS